MPDPDHLIFPYLQATGRSAKEHFLHQRAKTFWLTGLSCSGKTTIAETAAHQLFEKNFFIQVLDGDNIRDGINKDLCFTEKDRLENIRRVAEISRLFLQSGIITINCFITPTKALRNMAKAIIGAEDYVEIFIDASLDICESRDRKGLYHKARSGKLHHFPGISTPFDIPTEADLVIDTMNMDVESAAENLINFMMPLIRRNNTSIY